MDSLTFVKFVLLSATVDLNEHAVMHICEEGYDLQIPT